MSYLSTSVRCSIILLCSLTACSEPPLASGGNTFARLVITPGQARLAAVGDTMRLRAGLYDTEGNLLPGTALTWTSADPNVFTVDQSGLVTGRQAMSMGRAIATASGYADTAYVVVAHPDASPCLGSSAPVTLAVGQALSVSMTDGACITAAGSGDEYIVVPWYGTADGASTMSLDVTGSGLSAAPLSASRASFATVSPYHVSDRSVRTPAALRRDVAFERGIRELSGRELMPLARRGRGEFARRSSAGPLATVIPAYLGVGDLVQLNANGATACSSPLMRAGRVVAISARAIVVADTANPTGGFTSADYQRIATGYDTLVALVEDASFGTPTDIDANGKVVMFFTRAVNELTSAGASSYVAGFFHPRDLLPKSVFGDPYCTGSNEREMFYMLVPDPNGAVNGNALTVGFVDSLTMTTLAHENQHLVNFGRRVYVNDALTDEEVWLNEGLSHVAEELVFYRAAGLSPRANLGGERFGTQPFDGLFSMYMAPNFARLGVFLEAPQSFSPYSSFNDLGTRGAIWSFLRYAADRRGSSDGDVWMRLVNSPVGGFGNLFDVFGADLAEMINAWCVSVYTDDDTPEVDAAYTQPSWNFRSAFPALPTGARPYPLGGAIHALADGETQTVSLRGGSSAFFRFAIPAGKEAVLRLTSGGWMPPAAVQATIMRTR